MTRLITTFGRPLASVYGRRCRVLTVIPVLAVGLVFMYGLRRAAHLAAVCGVPTGDKVTLTPAHTDKGRNTSQTHRYRYQSEFDETQTPVCSLTASKIQCKIENIKHRCNK